MPVLSEADSKRLLAGYGVPFAAERVVGSAEDAIAHKTERRLVRNATFLRRRGWA